jgi:DNA-binding response OmpR family regulator
MIALPEAAAVGPPARAPVGGPRRALVLEDEEGLSQVWARLLRRDGYDVVCCGSALGLGALRRRWRPDVILLDLGLPYRSGVAFLTDLKADRATAGIPVVVLAETPDALAPARAALVAAVLTKPVAPHTLLATVGAAQGGRPRGGAAPVLPAGTAPGVADPGAGAAARRRRLRRRRRRPLPSTAAA